MNYINKLGAEYEGGWHGVVKGIQIHRDGSVSKPAGIDEVTGHWGEVSSPAFDTLAALEDWTLKAYPQAVNETCGMHIHASFRSNIYYGALMSRRFYNFFLREWDRWGHSQVNFQESRFWKRLEGTSIVNGVNFCEREFKPYQQVRRKDKNDQSRRTHLNFCWSLHGTIENRMLPCFKNVETAISALRCQVRIYEDFLSKEELKNDPTPVLIKG